MNELKKEAMKEYLQEIKNSQNPEETISKIIKKKQKTIMTIIDTILLTPRLSQLHHLSEHSCRFVHTNLP